eukprot:8105902-Ditylum_brightwellii.AAC.1
MDPNPLAPPTRTPPQRMGFAFPCNPNNSSLDPMISQWNSQGLSFYGTSTSHQVYSSGCHPPYDLPFSMTVQDGKFLDDL